MGKKNEENGVVVKPYQEVYAESVFENEEDIEKIGGLATMCIKDDLGVNFSEEKSKDTQDFRIPIVTVIKCFEAMTEYIRQQTKRYEDKFIINFANRFQFGYDNTDSETDDEKEGNFSPILQDIPEKVSVMEYSGGTNPVERAKMWMSENVTVDPVKIDDVAKLTYDKMKECDICYGSITLIAPIVVYVYDQLKSYIQYKRREEETDEYEINFCGCFTMIANETETGEDSINLVPSIEMKTFIKDDESSGHGIE